MMPDNLGLIGDNELSKTLNPSNKVVIPVVAFALCTVVIASVGLIKGIPAVIGN